MLTENHLKKLNDFLTRDPAAADHVGAYLKKADELADARAQFQRMMDYLFRLDAMAKEVKGLPPQQMIQVLRGDEEMADTADFAVASWTGNVWAAIERLSKALNEAGYLRSTTLTSFSAAAPSAQEPEQKSWTRPTGA